MQAAARSIHNQAAGITRGRKVVVRGSQGDPAGQHATPEQNGKLVEGKVLKVRSGGVSNALSVHEDVVLTRSLGHAWVQKGRGTPQWKQ